MDLGTGGLIFITAATWAPFIETYNPVSASLSNSIFLSIYGAVKFIIESTINYQEHVSEYGK